MKYPLFVLNNIENDSVFNAFSKYCSDSSNESMAELVRALYSKKAESNVCAYVENLIITDDNAFARCFACNQEASKHLFSGMVADLENVYSALESLTESNLFSLGEFKFLSGKGHALSDAENLRDFYKQNGYGKYIYNRAFTFNGTDIVPIALPSEITLDDLKDYVEEKRIVLSNVESFLLGLPHSNMLLYGERGTGKSSTVHAIVNKFFDRKLRIVEVNKENIFGLSALKSMLATIPMRFIIFIDDLSLSGGDERISTLKATLEGTLEGHSENTMIVATSNRRHIVDEKFSARNDSVHAGDSMQEELSLSDRFGISVLFASTTKPQYLSIIHQLASDYGVNMPEAELYLLAERWAISKGGRSPRRAKQFISMLSSAISRGVEFEF